MSAAGFRFAVTAPVFTTRVAWCDELRRLEDAGFDAVVVADHFTEGWTLEPMVALTAAAMATSTLRIQTGVLGNDYRHPVLVHRMAATLDAISEGRFTLGIGAGWLRADYEAAGIPLDPPGVRIDRLEASIAIIKGLFAGASRVPIMLGGGSPRVLRLAGREADIVSIVASLRAGALGSHAVADLAAERVEEKLGWVREGMGDRTNVTLSINHWLVRVTESEGDADAFLERVAARNGVEPALLRQSPAVLVGTVPQLVDTLQERRERFGFTHLQLDAGFPPTDVASLFALVTNACGR